MMAGTWNQQTKEQAIRLVDSLIIGETEKWGGERRSMNLDALGKVRLARCRVTAIVLGALIAEIEREPYCL